VNTYTVGGLIDGLYVVGIKAIYSDTNKNASAGYSYINVTGKNVENTVTLVSGSVSTTNNNGYKVITATSTASFTLLTNTKIGFILVGGGGGGGANGSNFGSCGGGGGGATYYMNYNNSTINTNNINITVGTGGAGYGSPTVRLANTLASNGSSGSFSKIYFSGDSSKYVTCNGGAFGNCDKSGVAINKGIGGVGGTVAASGITGGTSTSGGNGGSGYGYVNVDGTKGKNGTTITDTILSTTYYYGGGGGGGAWNLMSDVANASEACYGATIYGGGNGGRRSQPELLELLSSNGVLNTGGGGGGGSAYNGSGAGANGICLVYFPIIGFIISSFDYLPSAPTDLSVSTISTSIKISFKEPTETVTSYTVTAVTLNNTSVTKTFYAPATAYTFSNTDLGNSMYYTISLVASNSFGSSSPITITISPELFNPIATVPSLVNGYYADTYRTYSSVTLGTSILDGYWGSSLDKAGLAVSGYSSTTKGQGAWKPLNTDTTPWIKLDLTQNFIVTGITVKPRMSASLLTVVTGNEYVQTLKIETSTDNITFTSMTTNGTNTTFNTGIIAATSTTVDNTDTAYYIPIYGVSLARYVKVSPLSWNKAGQPALRVGVNYLIS
jgi:hypothetical protein